MAEPGHPQSSALAPGSASARGLSWDSDCLGGSRRRCLGPTPCCWHVKQQEKSPFPCSASLFCGRRELVGAALARGLAPSAGRWVCSSLGAPEVLLPGSTSRLLSARKGKMEKLHGLGAPFGARGKGEPPAQLPVPPLPAPHKPPLCTASRGTESPLHLGAWPGKKGSSALPGAKGLEYREGPVMLPSFLLAAWHSRCPGRGATGRERSHAASQCSGVGQLHTDPLCPHRLGSGTSAGLLGGFGSAELQRRAGHIPSGRQSLPEEHRQPRHKGCPRPGLALARHCCGKGKGCREICG